MDTLPSYIQVSSTLEFSRLVCALERTPRISFQHKHDGQKILSIQVDLLEKKPVIYFAPLEHDGNYLRYGVKDGKEESSIVDFMSDSSMLYSPIVKIKSLPSALKPGNGTTDRYQPIELEDLSSLAKMTWIFEEAPLPLFLFPKNTKWLVGVFMKFNEDGQSYFCYVMQDCEPQKPFLRFSTSINNEPIFVESPSEHGYSYAKIIKLNDTHPLVDYDNFQN